MKKNSSDPSGQVLESNAGSPVPLIQHLIDKIDQASEKIRKKQESLEKMRTSLDRARQSLAVVLTSSTPSAPSKSPPSPFGDDKKTSDPTLRPGRKKRGPKPGFHPKSNPEYFVERNRMMKRIYFDELGSVALLAEKTGLGAKAVQAVITRMRKDDPERAEERDRRLKSGTVYVASGEENFRENPI